MAYLNTCTELDDLGKGRFRHVHHIKPIAYLENGVYKLSSANVAAYADGTYTHAVLAANIGVRIGDDGKYAIHPTRELARYVAFGGPQVKVGGKWTQVPFSKPTRKDNSVVWTREQADLKLTHIGHGLKHEMALKGGYVPEGNLIAVAVNLVGLTRSGATLLADGVPVARIQSPVVYDADNREDTRPIKWDVVSRDGQPYIVYALPDLTGMAAPVVDPTLTLQPDAAAGFDTWTKEDTADTEYSTFTAMWSRRDSGADALPLLKWDVSSIPAGSSISSATLTVTVQADWVIGVGTLDTNWHSILAANSGWLETCTWNFADGAGASDRWAGDVGGDGGADAGCSVPGTDYNATAIGTTTSTKGDAVGTAYNASITPSAVAAWMTANYGMVGVAQEAGKVPRWCTSDHATAGYRPKLVVEYTLPSTGGGMLLLGVG